MTVRNEQKLAETLVEFLQHQIIHLRKKGVLIHFDGSLASLVNHKIAELISPKISTEHIIIVFNQNKFNTLNLSTLATNINIKPLIYDASNFSVPFQQINTSSKRRVEDLILGIKADSDELLILGNLCYSQWCINYPNTTYKNPEHIFLMNRLFYSELQSLARYFNISEQIVSREPMIDYTNGKSIKDSLGFSFDQLESFLRSDRSKTALHHNTIEEKLVSDDRLSKYNSPIFQRPCNFLT